MFHICPHVWPLQVGELQQLLQESGGGKEGKEMEEMIRCELDGGQQLVAQLEQELVSHLLSQNEAQMDSRNAILEVLLLPINRRRGP